MKRKHLDFTKISISKYLWIIVYFLNLLYIVLLKKGVGPYNWDMPGNLYQASSSLTNLSASIYNFKYYLGFFPILYPPLTHFLGNIAGNVFDSYYIYFAMMLVSRMVFFYLLYKIFDYFKTSMLLYLVVAYFSTVSSLAIDTMSFWHAGSVPAMLGLCLYLLFIYLFLILKLSKTNAILLGFVFGLTILTHTITASVLALLIVFDILLRILRKQWKGLHSMVYIVLFALLTGLIWIIPYISLNSDIPRAGIGGNGNLSIAILALFLLASISFSNCLKTKKDTSIKTKYISICFMLIILITVSSFVKSNFGGLHLYRYLYYGLFLGIPFIFQGTEYKWKYSISAKNKSLIIGVFILLIIILQDKSLANGIYPDITTQAYKNLSGRVVDSSTVSANSPFPHFFNTKLVETNTNLVAMGGLYVENAPSSLIALGVRTAINRSSYFPLYIHNIRNVSEYNRFDSLEDKLDLFGVNYIIYSQFDNPSDLIKGDAIGRLGNVRTAHRPYQPLVDLLVYKRDLDTKLVEVLKYLPAYSVDKDFIDEWQSLSLKNIYTTDKRISEYEGMEFNFENTSVENVLVQNDKLSFKVNSSVPVPVLIKFTYSDFLNAYSDGKKIDLLKVAPDFMMVVTKGNVVIRPEADFAFKFSRFITVLSLFVFSLVCIYIIVKRKIEFSEN